MGPSARVACTTCKAANIKPVMKLQLTDVDQGVMNIRWIERNTACLMVPVSASHFAFASSNGT